MGHDSIALERTKKKKEFIPYDSASAPILIIKTLTLKAVKNDLDRYQMGLCHMKAKSKSNQRVQYQIIVEVTSFVRSDGAYVNGDT